MNANIDSSPVKGIINLIYFLRYFAEFCTKCCNIYVYNPAVESTISELTIDSLKRE